MHHPGLLLLCRNRTKPGRLERWLLAFLNGARPLLLPDDVPRLFDVRRRPVLGVVVVVANRRAGRLARDVQHRPRPDPAPQLRVVPQ